MTGVCAVVGGQYGSEGKGAVVAHIARHYDRHVRVGAANAGHTLYTGFRNHGGVRYEKHVVQQLPCAAYANPFAGLFIGPGAIISKDILLREIGANVAWRAEHGHIPLVLHIDGRAHVIHEKHITREVDSGLSARIGSTSATAREGIGTATAARVMREAECQLAGEHSWPPEVEIVLVPDMLACGSESVLMEGTQGAGLSLTTGEFPFVTSRNTTSAGLCADAGIAPTRLKRVVVVVRTFPIRVAGNSGPFALGSQEIRWEDIDVDGETERTTVTKKVRRVATISYDQVREASILNGATEIALMFADYVDRDIAGHSGEIMHQELALDAHPALLGIIANIERAAGVPVRLLGTGPHTMLELLR